MSSLPTVSVIIPTYNRRDFLDQILNSLAQQTYPTDRFEVIVVDDGSTDTTAAVGQQPFPFTLRYFWQRNQGDAAARNYGAQQSQSDFLVFLDDDILLDAHYLTCLLEAHQAQQNRIVVGTWDLWQAEPTSFTRAMNVSLPTGAHHAQRPQPSERNPGHFSATVALPFRDAYSNNMSLRREAYFVIGMMQGLDFAGSSMWCDLEFAYRAHRAGFDFLRSTLAICWHRDHATRNLDTYKQRVKIAAYRAVMLFEKYPELLPYVPMFYDKTPIYWKDDPPSLIVRKVVRSLASSRLAVWAMEKLVARLENHNPKSALLPSLYRYVIGAHIYQGYRAGLSASAVRWAAGKVHTT